MSEEEEQKSLLLRPPRRSDPESSAMGAQEENNPPSKEETKPPVDKGKAPIDSECEITPVPECEITPVPDDPPPPAKILTERQLNPIRIMIAVKNSNVRRRSPNVAYSSVLAFQFVIHVIIRGNPSDFALQILNVQPETGLHGAHAESHIYRTPEEFLSPANISTDEGVDLLEYFVHKSRSAGVSCTAWVKRGHPHQVVLKEANRHYPSILVVGGHCPKFPKSVFGRNLGEYCIKNARCPVLVLPYVPERPAVQDEDI